MAEDIRSMRVELSMKDMGVAKSLGEIKRSFSTLRSEMVASSKMFSYSEKSISSYKNRLNDLKQAEKATEDGLKSLNRQHKEAVDAQGANSAQAQKLQREIANQEKELHFLQRSLKETTAEYKEFQRAQAIDSSPFTKWGKGLEGAQGKLRGFSEGLGKVGSGMTNYITKPALVAGGAVAGIFAKFGFDRLVGMDTAKAKLEGLGYSTKEVGRISDQVTNAVKGGMTTMAEGTDIAAGALAAGVKEGKDLEKYIKLVGDAAVGSNRPVGEMATIFNRVQGQGKLMTEELNMIEDGMPGFTAKMAESMGVSYEEFRKMVTNGEVTSEQFMKVMESHAGGMAEAYSKSWAGMVKNVTSYIGILGESMLKGVFPKMKESLYEFTKLLESEEAKKWAENTGKKLASAFSTISNAIQGVVKWFQGLSEGQQQTLLTLAKNLGLVLIVAGPILTVFSKMGLAVASMFGPISGLLLNLGKVHGAMKTGSTLGSAFASVFPKLGMVLGALTGPIGLTVLAIVAIGTALVVAYKKSETFRNIVNTVFSAIIAGAKWLWNGIVSFLTPIGQAFIKFGNQIKDALGDFWSKYGAQFVQAITNIWNFIQPILGFIGGLFKTVFGAIMVVLRPLISLLKFGLVNAFNIVKQAVIIAFGAVKGIIMGVLNVIMGAVKVFIGLFTGDWKLLGEGLKQIISSALAIVKNIFQLAFSGILAVCKVVWGLIKSVIGGAVKGIWSSIKYWFGMAKSIAISIFSALRGWIVTCWNFIKNKVVGFVRNLWTGIKVIWSALSKVTRSIFNGVRAFIVTIWTAIKNRVVSLARGLWNIIRGIFNVLSKVSRAIFSNLRNFLVSVWTVIKNRVVALARGLWNIIKGIWNFFSKTTRLIFSNLRSFFIKTWTIIKNRIIAFVQALWNRVKSIWNTLSKVTRNIFNSVRNFLYGLWQKIKNKIVALAQSLWNGVKGKFNALSSGTKKIFNAVRNYLVDKWTNIKNKVVDMATGIKDKVTGAFGKMRDTLKKIIKKITGFFDDMMGGVEKGLNSLNIIEPLHSNVYRKTSRIHGKPKRKDVGNHELSLLGGKCNDYLEREYNQVIGSGKRPLWMVI